MDPVTKELIDGKVQLLADAKLGRLVRKLAEQGVIHLRYMNNYGWSVVSGGRVNYYPTPEQALEAAGIKDE